MESQRARLREELLPRTLRFAAERSAFYAAHLGGEAKEVTGLADLARLRTTSKSDLAEHGYAMMTSRDFPARIGLSSGSTFGRQSSRPSQTFQSQDEVDLFRRLRATLFKGRGAATALTIAILNCQNGDQMLAHQPGTFNVPLEKSFHYEHIRRLLGQEFNFDGFSRRVEFIGGSLNQIKLLAGLLSDDEELRAGLALSGVFCYGALLTARWRNVLEEVFRAPLLNVYGVSEIAGAAGAQCGSCGGFHMPPFVIPEVVAPDDDHRVVERGVGELVLTSLYPFTQLQPLIRYRTGDLVEILPPCGSVLDVGFLPVGRVSNSIVSPDSGVLLPAAILYEAVDDLPDVARDAPARLAAFGVGGRWGEPRYRLERGDANGRPARAARVSVELHYDPRHFKDRAGEVRSSLLRRIEAVSTSQRGATDEPALRLEVSLLPPGALGGDVESSKFWV